MDDTSLKVALLLFRLFLHLQVIDRNNRQLCVVQIPSLKSCRIHDVQFLAIFNSIRIRQMRLCFLRIIPHRPICDTEYSTEKRLARAAHGNGQRTSFETGIRRNSPDHVSLPRGKNAVIAARALDDFREGIFRTFVMSPAGIKGTTTLFSIPYL